MRVPPTMSWERAGEHIPEPIRVRPPSSGDDLDAEASPRQHVLVHRPFSSSRAGSGAVLDVDLALALFQRGAPGSSQATMRPSTTTAARSHAQRPRSPLVGGHEHRQATVAFRSDDDADQFGVDQIQPDVGSSRKQHSRQWSSARARFRR
jgi:hypothetical protein